ncbi:MAG: hypothetical protein IJ189_13370 [Clostridia bacterium]|nr:hypothetical protein [Clostridia bacterium]
MKKILPLLLCALLLFSAAARAEEYPGYMLHLGIGFQVRTSFVYPMDKHNALIMYFAVHPEEEPSHIAWYRDGEKIRELPFYQGGATGALRGLEPVRMPDGSYRFQVIMGASTGEKDPKTGEEIIRPRCLLFDWTDEGLNDAIEIPVEAGMRVFHSGSFIVTYKSSPDADLFLNLYRPDGAWLLTGSVPGTQGGVLEAVTELENGVYLLTTNLGQLICLENGSIRWQLKSPGKPFPDGLGGFYTYANGSGMDYGPATLFHYNGDGQMDGVKHLSGNRVIVTIEDIMADPATGHTTVYGSAVANSRKIYTVFALTLDEHMDAMKTDVRGLSKLFGDYYPRLNLSPAGAAWVFTDDSQRSATQTCDSALVPFDKLPAATDNVGLKLE